MQKYDQYRFKVLKRLYKLIREESRLRNYRRVYHLGLRWLNLYKLIAKDYTDHICLSLRFNEYKYMAPKYLNTIIDEIRNWYAPTDFKNIIYDIYQLLPSTGKTLLMYNIKSIEGKLGESIYRIQLEKRFNRSARKLLYKYQIEI
jgi:hypothetical protein